MLRAGLALILIVCAMAVSAEEVKHDADSLEVIKKAVDEGKAVLVDVREEDEWNSAHVKGAILIPASRLNDDAALIAKLPKDKPIYVHCASGGRAKRCSLVWMKEGLDVRPVTYNVQGFEKAGFTIERPK
jgi:phage shock protein E